MTAKTWCDDDEDRNSDDSPQFNSALLFRIASVKHHLLFRAHSTSVTSKPLYLCTLLAVWI